MHSAAVERAVGSLREPPLRTAEALDAPLSWSGAPICDHGVRAAPDSGPYGTMLAMTSDGIDEQTLQAVAELLAAGERHGIGVGITPTGDGWRIDFLLANSGGYLAEADDLRTAAADALGPLIGIAEKRG